MPFFIDHLGDVVGLNDKRIHELGLLHSGRKLAHHLVVQKGWIEVNSVGPQCLIRARPKRMSAQTMLGLFYVLADSAPTNLAAYVYEADWEFRRFSSRQTLLTFLTSLSHVPQYAQSLGHERLLRKIIRSSESTFADIIPQALMIATNISDAHTMVDMLTKLKPIRWSVCRYHHDRQDSEHLSKSKNYTPFNPAFAETRPFPSLLQYADADYGRWAVAGHASAMTHMQPRFDHIDAIATFGSIGDVRLRYEMVTLPIKQSDGAEFVITGSTNNPAIDLRADFVEHNLPRRAYSGDA